MSITTTAIYPYAGSLLELRHGLELYQDEVGVEGEELRWATEHGPGFPSEMASDVTAWVQGIFTLFVCPKTLVMLPNCQWRWFLTDQNIRGKFLAKFWKLADILQARHFLCAPDSGFASSAAVAFAYDGCSFEEIRARLLEELGPPKPPQDIFEVEPSGCWVGNGYAFYERG